ncbi:SMP-30/gluconolactonase/LRE family protein [Hasllibacter sp. MH4015]|uniref:SMP-30/gluconolactonase/LRE family protein n=1 Tax=Hasllibacter sp. MH4015 TaxID=2854029 RepID=UPI001CD5CD04|nr:SMP-30/gluconolactonase/LRE family protein [Hasllibacter sp. MH4015]
MSVEVYDDRACLLGEGPLWHPGLGQLFWFDIHGQRLLTRDADGAQGQWDFDRAVSAAGWVDDTHLLVATETDLTLFDLASGGQERVADLEPDNIATRSNDGRADPQGGFWIGTMGHNAEKGAGALYRFYRGQLRRIRGAVTIPNATCFAPDGRRAYFADTAEHLVLTYDLDPDGWPEGEPRIFLDHREREVNPDGAVVDADGRFWCAEWGASRVACYSPEGNLLEEIILPVPQPTCPAFGPDGLYVTTAQKGAPDAPADPAPLSGQTLRVSVSAKGQAEHRVIL